MNAKTYQNRIEDLFYQFLITSVAAQLKSVCTNLLKSMISRKSQFEVTIRIFRDGVTKIRNCPVALSRCFWGNVLSVIHWSLGGYVAQQKQLLDCYLIPCVILGLSIICRHDETETPMPDEKSKVPHFGISYAFWCRLIDLV